MNNFQGKNSMAAFLMNENLEPATRTLDFVRLVFHFCNFVNLTLGGIAFGVGIGYDLTPINVSGSSSLRPVQTKFIVTGVFVLIHGLIGAYGFVSRQSRTLIVYGCLGFCLLIVGSVAAWTALQGETSITSDSRDHFYTKWKDFNQRIDHFVKTKSMVRISHTDCECTQLECQSEETTHCTNRIVPCWSAKEGLTPKDPIELPSPDDQYIWNIICVQKFCHMRYIPDDVNETEYDEELTVLEEQAYYVCRNQSLCNDKENCDLACDKNTVTYDEKQCNELCSKQLEPYTCIRYVKILTQNRVVTMYVTLFMLSVTQTVCLLCDILFIFWSLKEETDIECHQQDNKRASTKLRLLSRFLPCCFSLPEPSDNAGPANSNVALSDIFSASEQESSPATVYVVTSGPSNSSSPNT